MDFIEISCVNWISCLNHTGREKSVVAEKGQGRESGPYLHSRVQVDGCFFLTCVFLRICSGKPEYWMASHQK